MDTNTVLIYYTGGTIGMIKGPNGRLIADPNFPNNLRKALESEPGLPAWRLDIRERLLDSSNMTPADWASIAAYIVRNQNSYKAIVVLHGTDTMAYTTSALPFMINCPQKPIIFTGSQIPLSQPGNDARSNVIYSLRAAADYALPKPEVCLFFGTSLLRGCRSVKVDTASFTAFDSPNFPHLATVVDGHLEFNTSIDPPPGCDETDTAELQELTETRAGVLRLFPGISSVITQNFLADPIKGVVLHTYGSGNGPTNDKKFTDALEKANADGVILVACTQCLKGGVSPDSYETGLGRFGVVNGYDMTVEAALPKLFWLLSRGLPPREIKAQIEKNLRGELTRPNE